VKVQKVAVEGDRRECPLPCHINYPPDARGRVEPAEYPPSTNRAKKRGSFLLDFPVQV
jgi:hypothetical protein